MRGVVRTTVGYTGGATKYPNYNTVCAGDGHTEAIRIEYDPAKVSFAVAAICIYDGPLTICVNS